MSNAAETTVHRTTLEALKSAVYSAPPLRQVREALAQGADKVEYVRSAGSLNAFVAASLVENSDSRLLYIAPGAREAERVRDDLRTLLGEDRALFLPPRSAIPYDPLRQNTRFEERAGAFEKLVSGNFDVIITIPPALVEHYESLEVQRSRLIRFRRGDEIDREALIMVLGEAGMSREVRAEGPGQFAVRGAIVDIFPPAAEYPVRLELWDDEIIELRYYDPVTQRSNDSLEAVEFYAGEETGASRSAGIWELLENRVALLIDDYDALVTGLERTWEEIEYQFARRCELEKDVRTPRPGELFFSRDEVLSALDRRRRVIHRGTGASSKGAIDFQARSHESYLGDLGRVAQNLRQNRIGGISSFILCDRESQSERLLDMLLDHGMDPVDASIGVGSLHEGFTWPAAKLVVLTDHQVFGRSKRTAPFRKRRRRVDSTAFEHLQKDDYVVHTDFGIGRYLGLKKIKVGRVEQECLQIEYRDGVKVYIRLDQFARLQKYQGTDGAAPKLSRIGGADWANAKKRAGKAVEEMAKEIIDLYARRRIAGGFSFTADTPWQREMEAAFEFDDTPDQAVAAEEIKRDMERPVAMDRLLCGDVGFGKTEVALRAAFKAVQDSAQVAVLAPTTVLAQQHYRTFTERLRRYPVDIEVLSRFRTRREQKEVLEGLKSGEVDIVIGTHRLLSRDVRFHNLGLLIIDEEHRFGLRHKEKLKQLRVNVDVLTLSATPIPRTLQMALSGAKDMSMIATPPVDRLPIETEIVAFDERVIREAIIREIARGGQVYFLHNRVKSITAIRHMLERLVPGVKMGIAHGQMKERELEKVMDDFIHERFQVLICTMIIESGLDLPNVNTLIVNRADSFGVAQLYQLRGRIGRSHKQAYAYLLTPPRMLLNRDAKKRLETIVEHTRLGSGFQVAMRDLEIRGAGNLLGPQQSGFINSVGYELYAEMLGSAVKQLSREGETELPDLQPDYDPRRVRVDVAVDAVLPTDYVDEPSERVEFYRRLSRADSPEEVRAIRTELVDRFGPLPEEAGHLLDIVEVQTLAVRDRIARVDIDEEAVFIEFEDDWGGDKLHDSLAELMRVTEDMQVELKGTGNLGLKMPLSGCDGWSERWGRLKQLLEAIPEESE